MTFKKLFTTFVRQRGALSGVKEKFSGIIDQNLIRIAESSERSHTTKLVGNSFLNDKMKRKYLRIVDERVKRFIRKSK